MGFYYAANALGRFFGTLLSGLLYQWGGLLFSLVGSAAMLTVCWLVTLALPVTVRRTDAQASLEAGIVGAAQPLPQADVGAEIGAHAEARS